MFERLIRFAIEQRIVVMIAVLIMAGIGVYSYQKLPIDAVPDITNVQVQVNTAAPGCSGLSQVTVIFEDGTDIFFARQQVNERLQVAKEQLPDGVDAVMGPVSTGLGEIFLWTVETEKGDYQCRWRADSSQQCR